MASHKESPWRFASGTFGFLDCGNEKEFIFLHQKGLQQFLILVP